MRKFGVAKETADSLVSEALTIAWQKLDEVPPAVGESEAWLHGVTRKLLANHWTVSRRADERERRYSMDRLAGGRLVEDGAEADRLLVRDAWSLLRAPDREVLRLALSGLGPDRLGAHLGCSPSAASVRLTRARARLRRAMED